MADDNIQQPSDPLHPIPPARNDHATTAVPPNPPLVGAAGSDRVTAVPPAPRTGTAPAVRSELEQFLRWGAGLFLVLAAGWGIILGVALLAYAEQFPISVGLAAILTAALSLGFFILVERDFWLSRFMGLRVEAPASPLKEAFFLWLMGVPGLLWRSTEGKDAAPTDQKTQSEVSNTREVIETVVFVVVLVLLLKSFVAEAFVIPTGSMATTLWGYQKNVKCPECGYEFPVNCSQEVDPQEGERVIITGCTCPNCRLSIPLAKLYDDLRDPRTGARLPPVWKPLPEYKADTGDRVLVGKFLYDLPWNNPERNRLNVVVFKYPKEPQKNFTPLNYIKRLIGLPGESIAIYYGKIYVLSAEEGLRYDDSTTPEVDRWRYEFMHVDSDQAHAFWEKGKFKILRKPPEVVLAMRRIVYDNDHPAKDLEKFPRWTEAGAAKAWASDDATHTFKHAATEDSRLAWLRYRHIIARNGRNLPELITDFMGYNSYTTEPPQQGQQVQHWVGDLMVECEVKVDKAEGQMVLELSRGIQRFRAVFDLATGDCTLKQIKRNAGESAPADDAGEELARKPTALKKPGTYKVRFANVDDRLLLWVDRSLPFGADGVPYNPAEEKGPYSNDLEPASIGVRGGGVTVGKLQLWRDTYYTQMHGDGRDDYPSISSYSDPKEWDDLRRLHVMTLYVQPGHYLCLGDNSPHSSDGRAWGLVPDRLMLGRALVVYYPFNVVHGWPGEARVGPIH
jgi:signal peptidase I